MTIFLDWLRKLGRTVITQPLSIEVASCQEEYGASVGLKKLGLRVLWRKMLLIRWGQSVLLCEQARPEWKKCLWIYVRTAQVGDSLMDLACRNIYRDMGIHVDLLTTKSLSDLYDGDSWFDSVSCKPTDFSNNKYDFIIIQSVHHRALKEKVKFFKNTPWICIQGFYDVPDFSRSEWGARRVFDLWRKTPSSDYFNYSARQKFSTQSDTSKFDIDVSLVIAVGGIDAVRTYTHWSTLIDILVLENAISKVTLIGSGVEAQMVAEEILRRDAPNFKVKNLVGSTTLSDCFHILGRASLFVAADGGLLHLAVAASTQRIVSLFIVGIPPELRIPNNYRSDALISATGDVNDIDVRALADKILSR